ncbi:cysteine hydrolase [Gracilibacillus sp. YIM 98692]|uniref:cysteine hydrolase family protein n=1 Tax=Gracilibacillus sp. YIM 98692 TaxID=2663532 RepID=UPI0013D8D6C6|nr:cysteine hydrolase [Gracilibacillus sp. YIM 98692]
MCYNPKKLCLEKRSALMIIDMQNDFVNEQGAFAKSGVDVKRYQALEPTILSMIELARKEGIPIIFVQMEHNDENDGDGAWKERRIAKKHPNTCREGTWGVEFYNHIQPMKEDIVIKKHRYTAFINKELHQKLQSMKIETLIFAGINTNTCVESTVRDAHHLDYHVVVIEDATTAAFDDAYEPSLKNIRRHYGAVIGNETWQQYYAN